MNFFIQIIYRTFVELNLKTKSMRKITFEDVSDLCSTLSKTKGNYIIRRGFFYNTSSPEYMINRLKERFPDVIIIDSGQKWKAFRGGDSVAQGSHYWVIFNFPTPITVKILKNDLTIKEFSCTESNKKKVIEKAIDVAGGMWNGKDNFTVIVG